MTPAYSGLPLCHRETRLVGAWQSLSRGLTVEEMPVLSNVHFGGEGGTVPEFLFEKKGLILVLQQLLVSANALQK